MNRLHTGLSLSIFFALIMATLVWLHGRDAPVTLMSVDKPQIACLSYAPYRRPNQSPFRNRGTVTKAQIREDLELLKPLTGCVRTYAVTQGLEAVPAIARELGLTVLLGTWIGRNHEENLTHLQAAIDLANRHAGVVTALIVGNEVLLRREQPRERIAEYLRFAKRRSTVPVTYADVWEFWDANRDLAQSVDFLTVHILPYWEDHPVAIENAVAHVWRIRDRISHVFTSHRIVIGETGWPSVGRMRGPAEPGRVAQARFVREFLHEARARTFTDYNLIEAFDQPWKRDLEGAMGAGWGLISSQGDAKFALSGPVSESNHALRTALLGALLLTVVVLVIQRSNNAVEQIVTGLSVFLAGSLLPTQFEYLVAWSRSPIEWAAGLSVVIAGLALCVFSSRLVAGQPTPGLFNDAMDGRQLAWRIARFVLLFGLAILVLLHASDPRYRGYATVLYLPGVAALIATRIRQSGAGTRWLEEESLLAAVILMLLPAVLWSELPSNHQAILFVVVSLGAALSCLPLRAIERTPISKQIKAATAPGSGA